MMKKIFCLYALLLLSTTNNRAQTTRADLLYQKATDLYQHDDIPEAVNKLHEVIAIDPTHLLANFRLGFFAQVAGNYQEAINFYRHAIASEDPRYNTGSIHYNAGTCLQAIGSTDEALVHFQQAVILSPHNSNLHKSLGELYLSYGDFAHGWQELENCWGADWQARKAILQQPDLTGVTILVHDGDGYGDTFNWLRFVKLLKQKHATIYLKARPSLIPLFSLCDYIDKIFPQGSPLPTCTVEVGFLQLTPIFCNTVADIPHDIPYLTASPEREEFWRKELTVDHQFKIGICWECKTYIDNATQRALEKVRALPLMQFYAISKLPGISLYSLQFVDGIDQLAHIPADFTIHQFDQTFDKSHGRFIDTAAVMKNLDLIITVDTSIAHLAGALGIPVWVLLPYVADWRWFRDRTDSPWYPSMRLFRQKTLGDWSSVMQEVEHELQKMISHL